MFPKLIGGISDLKVVSSQASNNKALGSSLLNLKNLSTLENFGEAIASYIKATSPTTHTTKIKLPTSLENYIS